MSRSVKSRFDYTNEVAIQSLHSQVTVRRRFLKNITPPQPSPTFKPNPPYSTYRNK